MANTTETKALNDYIDVMTRDYNKQSITTQFYNKYRCEFYIAMDIKSVGCDVYKGNDLISPIRYSKGLQQYVDRQLSFGRSLRRLEALPNSIDRRWL